MKESTWEEIQQMLKLNKYKYLLNKNTEKSNIIGKMKSCTKLSHLSVEFSDA